MVTTFSGLSGSDSLVSNSGLQLTGHKIQGKFGGLYVLHFPHGDMELIITSA